ncbi:MAG: FkbM family methyltransferase [Bacteroidota bacterium]
MASVNSPIRKLIKPLMYKMMPSGLYLYLQYLAKAKDIRGKLVEEEELQILPHILRADSNCIDIGANFAYISERLSTLCPKGKIYAFEPIPFTYKVAEKIIQKFRLKNVSLYQLGVGNENTKMTFEVPLQEFGAYSAGQAHITGRDNSGLKGEGQYKFNKFEAVDCTIVRLDDFKEINVPIDFVKIDIEGAELFAIQGMDALIRRDLPVIYMEINPLFLKAFNLTDEILQKHMEDLGYQFYSYVAGAAKITLNKEAFVEANYFLIPVSKVEQYNAIIV